ncbi:MAG: MotA/TolQ/ExbB proton channel family protein [Piscinibacter sp.]|uniref:MotA/TolQ/ExbB proton channel family protein n=1 Tax=Piscinibacter TaxID=1114981 RepID=UPI000FDD3718|nr:MULTISPECIES: MotA/TolQ/ExbB proton channel family protein [Piscinibacter]MCW5663925.1 MotA/TolQ/ExbB proton channel family protein [Piscinibacter sp.]
MFLRKSITALVLTLAAALAPQFAAAQAADAASAAPAAAPAEPAPAPMPPVATTAKETVDNPYGLQALWAQGDFVAKGTLVILVLMSMGSWYILVTKLYESLKISGEAKAARASFFKAASLQEGAKKLKEGSAFRFIAETGIDAGEHHEGELTENIDRNTWVTMSVQRSVDEVQSRLQDGLAFLATVGSTAPFIGLFGTVWGIYHALTAIGIAGQASIDKVAGPVGEALIMTAIGLAVAVPAVLGYNWLVRRNKVTLDAVRGFAADLHGVLMGAKATR